MKIAVPYDNGNVFQHFGRTEAFKYYQVTDGVVTAGEVISTNGIGHEALADVLAENGADAVICGGLGSGAMNALTAAGIQVISGAQGSTDEAVQSFLRGELTCSEVNCNHHHEEDPGCGGSCGSGEDSCGNGSEEDGCGCCGSEEDGCGCCGSEEDGCGCCDSEEGSCGCCGSEEGSCGGGCGGCGHHIPVEGKNVGARVRVHYEGTLDDGTRFDSSYERNEPLEFVCGSGQMIHGFDQAVAQMNVGEIVNVRLEPEEAYGMPDPAAVMVFRIRDLPGSENLVPGQRVQLEADNGQIVPVRVTARDGETITLDANHEMAGKALNFKIELVEIL